jgi:hypothetical protein
MSTSCRTGHRRTACSEADKAHGAQRGRHIVHPKAEKRPMRLGVYLNSQHPESAQVRARRVSPLRRGRFRVSSRDESSQAR